MNNFEELETLYNYLNRFGDLEGHLKNGVNVDFVNGYEMAMRDVLRVGNGVRIRARKVCDYPGCESREVTVKVAGDVRLLLCVEHYHLIEGDA